MVIWREKRNFRYWIKWFKDTILPLKWKIEIKFDLDEIIGTNGWQLEWIKSLYWTCPIEIYTAAVSSTVSHEYFPGPVIDINQNFHWTGIFYNPFSIDNGIGKDYWFWWCHRLWFQLLLLKINKTTRTMPLSIYRENKYQYAVQEEKKSRHRNQFKRNPIAATAG